MDRLVEAVRVGDVLALHRIVEEDPQIPKRACLACFEESPLHVAALEDKVDFVKAIIPKVPSLVTERNQKGLIPLHVASAAGHVKIVVELLNNVKLDDEVNQCLVQDDNGWTPLHYAAFRGRVDVIKELIEHCPEGVEEVTARGETVLHLAVKANQFEAVKVIVEWVKSNFHGLLGAKDNNGKTIEDLPGAKKKLQGIPGIGKGMEIEETRITMEVKEGETEAFEDKEKEASGESATAKAEKDNKDSEDVVLVVATLIITLTYEALLSPPLTIFKKGTEIDWGCISVNSNKKCPAEVANAMLFLLFNSLIFFTSILMIFRILFGRLLGFQLGLLIIYLTVCYFMLLWPFSDQIVFLIMATTFLFSIFIVLFLPRRAPIMLGMDQYLSLATSMVSKTKSYLVLCWSQISQKLMPFTFKGGSKEYIPIPVEGEYISAKRGL